MGPNSGNLATNVAHLFISCGIEKDFVSGFRAYRVGKEVALGAWGMQPPGLRLEKAADRRSRWQKVTSNNKVPRSG